MKHLKPCRHSRRFTPTHAHCRHAIPVPGGEIGTYGDCAFSITRPNPSVLFSDCTLASDPKLRRQQKRLAKGAAK